MSSIFFSGLVCSNRGAETQNGPALCKEDWKKTALSSIFKVRFAYGEVYLLSCY
jgi:hypothetical protein